MKLSTMLVAGALIGAFLAAGLVYVPGAVTLQEVVEVLNVLGATPRELIGIIEGMSQAGLLLAEVERL